MSITFMLNMDAEQQNCRLVRKLEPLERHYYQPNEYEYTNGEFWLTLSSTAEDSIKILEQIISKSVTQTPRPGRSQLPAICMTEKDGGIEHGQGNETADEGTDRPA